MSKKKIPMKLKNLAKSKKSAKSQKSVKTKTKSVKNLSSDLSSEVVDRKSQDLSHFQENVMALYKSGHADRDLQADETMARSILPPSTAQARSFASLIFEYPVYDSSKCIACMECVVECPDAAIYARVTPEKEKNESLAKIENPEDRAAIEKRFYKTQKFWEVLEKRGKTPGEFSIWIDPDKCKGCGECAAVCGEHNALVVKRKEEVNIDLERKSINFMRQKLPATPPSFINEKLFVDMFLLDDHWIYKGGAGACKGCGEVTSLKMALTATSAKYGSDMAIVAATGCNSVFSSTYPYNIFSVPWTNSLFENAPAMAMGVRLRMNQTGKKDTKIWVVGGDGAMGDIGFQSLSRMLMSGEDIKVLVMDTQVYSNTGGQASGSTFQGQNAKMSACGISANGKSERRKELGLILMSHPDVYVAQVSPSHYNHFLRSVLSALEYPGPAVIIAYSPCMPEHGIADNASFHQSHAAVTSRAFPIFSYDPRAGKTIKEKLDLRGNPSLNDVWFKDPKTGETKDFTWFARQEERFAKLFKKDGTPTEPLIKAQEDRFKNWNTLRELAGLNINPPVQE